VDAHAIGGLLQTDHVLTANVRRLFPELTMVGFSTNDDSQL
jgi:hypothetical protein